MADRTRVPSNTDDRPEAPVRTEVSKAYWTPARVVHTAYIDWMKMGLDGPRELDVRHVGEFVVRRLQEAGYRIVQGDTEASDG